MVRKASTECMDGTYTTIVLGEKGGGMQQLLTVVEGKKGFIYKLLLRL